MSRLKRVVKRALAFAMAIALITGMIPLSLSAKAAEGDVFAIKVLDSSDNTPLTGVTVTYTVAVDGVDGPGGTVTTDVTGVASVDLSALSDSFSGGKMVTMEYSLSGIEGYAENSGNATLSSVSDSITAYLTKLTYTLTVNCEGNGIVRLNGAEQSSITVEQNEDVEVEIIPDTDSYIKELVVAGVTEEVNKGEAYSSTITMDGNKEIDVTFSRDYTVTVTNNGTQEQGSITLDGDAVDSLTVEAGDQVALVVEAKEGYQILNVSIDGESQDLTDKEAFTKEFVVNTNVQITVEFVKVWKVNVTTNGETLGSISAPTLDGGSVTVNAGEDVEVVATPAANHRVVTVKIDGETQPDVSAANDSGYTATFSNIDADHSVEVTFAPNAYSVSVVQTTNGSVLLSTERVNYGNSCDVTIVPEEGYIVESIRVNYGDEELSNSFTIENITSDIFVEVTFKEIAKIALKDADLSISQSIKKNGKTEIYAKNAEVAVSTSKDGIRLYGEEGFIGGSETEGTVFITDSCKITKIELYYQATDEWKAEWHPVEGISAEEFWKEIVFDTYVPGVTFSAPECINGYYSADVEIGVDVKDTEENKPYSGGIKKIAYSILSESAQQTDVTLYELADDASAEDILTEKTGLIITVDAEDYNCDDIQVSVTVLDRAGNSVTETMELNINSTRPGISVEISGTEAQEADDKYYNQKRVATVTFTDRAGTFDINAATNAIMISGEDAQGNGVVPNISWDSNTDSDIRVATVTFEQDAKYDWGIAENSYVNKAGLTNETVNASGEDIWNFTVDTTPATAEIRINEVDAWDELLETLTFRIWKNTRIVPTVANASDETGGIKDIWYYKTDATGILGNDDLEELFVNHNDAFFKDPLKIEENGTYVVYARILDRAGNVTYISTEAMIYEDILCSIELAPDETQAEDVNGKGYYYEDFDIAVTVKDYPEDDEDAVSSGIKEVYYTITKDDGVEGDKVYLYLFTEENPLLTDLKHEFSGEEALKITINAAENKANNAVVTVTAVDNAGNISSAKVENIRINATKLSGEIGFEGEQGLDVKIIEGVGGFYNFDRTAIIKVKEDKHVFSQKDATDGIHVTLNGQEDVVASEDTYTVEWMLEDELQTAKVHFHAEGTYEWYFEYQSRGQSITKDNISFEEGTKTPTKFVIDKTKQDIRVTSADNEVKNIVSNRGYFADERILQITYTERNEYFVKEEAVRNIDIIAKDLAGNDIPDAYVILDDQWEYVENTENPDLSTHTLTLKFTKDANYTIDFNYKDIAGNVSGSEDVMIAEGTVTPFVFTIDREAPSGVITAYVGGAVRGTWDNWIIGSDRNPAQPTFKIWTPNTITLKAEGKDTISALAGNTISYYVDVAHSVDDTDLLNVEQLEMVTWTAMDMNAGYDVIAEQQCIVYFRLADVAGNVAFLRSDGLILDKSAPSTESLAPSVYLTTVQAENGIYNSDVSVGVKVVEPMRADGPGSQGTYSGIQSVSYTVTSGGGTTQGQILYSYNENSAQAGIDGCDERGLRREYGGSFVVKASENNSDHVVVEVVATDNAGNQSKKSITLKIDVTKPVINISYDNNTADSTAYFKDNRVATIVVTERNFKPEYVSLDIKNTEGILPQLSGWSQAGSGDSTTWTATLSYVADGDYEFGISMHDMAGNECQSINYGNSVEPTKFTIDKNDPIIRVSYDNNEAQNDKYFDAVREATVTITEHNFDFNRVTFTRTASKGGNIIELPEVNWSHNGDVHIARIQYDVDGDYTFDVSVQDMAGRTNSEVDYMNSVAAKQFTVDTTIEEPKISGVVDMQPYKDEVIPVISFNDINYDTYKVQLLRTRLSEKDKDVTEEFIKVITENQQGGNGTNDTFAKIAENDGIYTLIVTVADKAGNEATRAVKFTVNRFGSIYAYGDYLISLIADGGAFVQQVEDALVITEYNADRLVEGSLNIEILKDGKPIENPVYDVSPVMADSVAVGISGWFEYVYTIGKENFATDGVYKISVASKDAAGNSPENTNYEDMSILFRVDKTVPEITSIMGLEEGIVNAQEQTVKYEVFDAIGLKNIRVYVDGAVKAEVNDFTSDYNNYAGSFVLGESTTAQSVRILVEDLAGNITDTASESFTSAYAFVNSVMVSTNVFVRWFANKPLFWGTVATGGVVTAGSAGFLSLRRRRKIGIK